MTIEEINQYIDGMICATFGFDPINLKDRESEDYLYHNYYISARENSEWVKDLRIVSNQTPLLALCDFLQEFIPENDIHTELLQYWLTLEQFRQVNRPEFRNNIVFPRVSYKARGDQDYEVVRIRALVVTVNTNNQLRYQICHHHPHNGDKLVINPQITVAAGKWNLSLNFNVGIMAFWSEAKAIKYSNPLYIANQRIFHELTLRAIKDALKEENL